MVLAMQALDPTVQGILFLVAVVLFVVAAILARPSPPITLIAAGLAFATFVFCWQAFSAAG